MREKLEKYLVEKKFKNEVIKEKCIKILVSDRYKEKELETPDITLKELEIKRFLGINSENINYKNKIVQITGLNSTGKTFIAESPRMMMFNSGRTVVSNLLEENTRNKLVININDNDYELVIDKKSWYLYKDDPITPFKKGQTEILKHFKAIGIDETLEKLVFIKNEGSYITEQDPAVFKEYILGMSGIGNLVQIKKDISKKIDDNERDIEKKEVLIETLKTDEGVNSIKFEIETLKKDMANEEILKKELINLATDGADVAAKKIDEIEKLKSKKSLKESDLEKIEYLTSVKDVFKNHKKASDEFKKLESEYDKLQKDKEKILKDKKSIELDIELLETSLEKLETIDQKCPTCESEIPDIKKKVMVKDKQDKIDKLKKKLESFDTMTSEEPINPDTIKGAIDEYDKKIESLKDTYKIKSEKELTDYLAKNNKADIKKGIDKIEKDIEKKQSEYNKLIETDNSKRKDELEKKLDNIKESAIKLNELENKIKQIEDNNNKIDNINKEIEDLRDEIAVFNTMTKIFDKNNKESFPAWLVKYNLKGFTDIVNKEFEQFHFNKGQLDVEINEKFEFITRGYRSKSLSNSENRILNVVSHINLLLLKFKEIPFLIVDDYSMALDKNIKLELNNYLNELIKEGKIKNLILTDPSTDKLKVDYLKKI